MPKREQSRSQWKQALEICLDCPCSANLAMVLGMICNTKLQNVIFHTIYCFFVGREGVLLWICTLKHPTKVPLLWEKTALLKQKHHVAELVMNTLESNKQWVNVWIGCDVYSFLYAVQHWCCGVWNSRGWGLWHLKGRKRSNIIEQQQVELCSW